MGIGHELARGMRVARREGLPRIMTAPGIFDDPDSYPGKVLDQPYAGAVRLAAEGYRAKNIETRPMRILRVPCDLVIVAGTTMQGLACLAVMRRLCVPGRVPEAAFDRAVSLRGCAVALVRVVECRLLTAEDEDRALWWDEAENARKPRWAWELDDMRPLRPFPVRGIPGFVRVPRAAVAAAL